MPSNKIYTIENGSLLQKQALNSLQSVNNLQQNNLINQNTNKKISKTHKKFWNFVKIYIKFITNKFVATFIIFIWTLCLIFCFKVIFFYKKL